MNHLTLGGDILAVAASLVALYYIYRMWRLVRAPSRLVLLGAMFYMVATRLLIIALETGLHATWIEGHRSLIIVPQYVLFAIAFAMTYRELKDFQFDVPKDAEDRDTQAKHLARMEEQSVPMKEGEHADAP